MCSSISKCFFKFKFIKVQKLIITRIVHYDNVDLNIEYLCNPLNTSAITENIQRRKGVGNIQKIINLHSKLKQLSESTPEYVTVKQQFISEALKIPNETHKDVIKYENNPKLIKFTGNKRKIPFHVKEFHEITRQLNLMRTSQLGNVTGARSYYFVGALAELEQALIRFTITKLIHCGFKILSVPDILTANIIQNCGMEPESERTQVYKLINNSDFCLSGTSEMGIAGYFTDKIMDLHQLPVKIAAVSRCYRAETSSVAEEKGIYRVHQFTKVEMFAVTHPDTSDSMLESFKQFEEDHFSSLGLHLQTLDMPAHELGAPAYRKYDVEAWLPGRNIYGEVSSCSNCTDFQSRRLRIRYKDNEMFKYAHTVNGTALAVPRILIALLETYQNQDGSVNIPDILKPYLKFDKITKEKRIPELKLKKVKR